MSTSSRFAVAVHILTLLASARGTRAVIADCRQRGDQPGADPAAGGAAGGGRLRHLADGRLGGSTLARPADRITLLDVFRAVESPVLIALPHSQPNPACEVGREITGVLERVTARAQSAMEAELAAQTIAGMLAEVGRAQRRRA